MQYTLASGTAATVETTCVFDAEQFTGFILACSNLAGAETVEIYLDVAGTMTRVYDDAGATVNLTPTRPSIWLVGGAKYGFKKSSTADVSTLTVNPGPLKGR